MQIDLAAHEDFLKLIQNNKTVAVYFSTPDCNVCKILKPKITELLSGDFPEFTFAYVNGDENKITAAQNAVFTVPTLIFFVEGKEVIRKSRNISLAELSGELDRICSYLN